MTTKLQVLVIAKLKIAMFVHFNYNVFLLKRYM